MGEGGREENRRELTSSTSSSLPAADDHSPKEMLPYTSISSLTLRATFFRSYRRHYGPLAGGLNLVDRSKLTPPSIDGGETRRLLSLLLLLRRQKVVPIVIVSAFPDLKCWVRNGVIHPSSLGGVG